MRQEQQEAVCSQRSSFLGQQVPNVCKKAAYELRRLARGCCGWGGSVFCRQTVKALGSALPAVLVKAPVNSRNNRFRSGSDHGQLITFAHRGQIIIIKLCIIHTGRALHTHLSYTGSIAFAVAVGPEIMLLAGFLRWLSWRPSLHRCLCLTSAFAGRSATWFSPTLPPPWPCFVTNPNSFCN